MVTSCATETSPSRARLAVRQLPHSAERHSALLGPPEHLSATSVVEVRPFPAGLLQIGRTRVVSEKQGVICQRGR